MGSSRTIPRFALQEIYQCNQRRKTHKEQKKEENILNTKITQKTRIMHGLTLEKSSSSARSAGLPVIVVCAFARALWLQKVTRSIRPLIFMGNPQVLRVIAIQRTCKYYCTIAHPPAISWLCAHYQTPCSVLTILLCIRYRPCGAVYLRVYVCWSCARISAVYSLIYYYYFFSLQTVLFIKVRGLRF